MGKCVPVLISGNESGFKEYLNVTMFRQAALLPRSAIWSKIRLVISAILQ